MARSVLVGALILLGLLGPSPARGGEESQEARAKALYESYLAERSDDSWGAFLRRLDVLRELGQVPAQRARKDLLRVARTGKTLDDRTLAALGIARYGDTAAVRDLLRLLASPKGESLVEIVSEGLAGTKQGDVLAWLAEQALAWKERHGLLAVVRAHARHGMPESRERLAALVAEHLDESASTDLLHAGVLALGRIGGSEVHAVLLAAAEHADLRVRLGAAEALSLQDPGATGIGDALRALLADSEAVVRRTTVENLGAAKREALLPDMATLLSDGDPRVAKAACDALRAMTGQDFGFEEGTWVRWWKDRDAPPKPLPGTKTVASYHGVKIHSNRVLFVLDRSGSMRWPHAAGETCRMDEAQKELVRVLRELPAKTVFNVLAFDTKVSAWRRGEAQATPRNVEKAVKWVLRQEAERGAGTNTHGVLAKAFEENLEFDTIFFLSDGLPEDGDAITTEAILAAVRGWNRYRRVKIHTIALTLEHLHPGKYPIPRSVGRIKTFMSTLAKATGGDHKLVTKPPHGRR